MRRRAVLFGAAAALAACAAEEGEMRHDRRLIEDPGETLMVDGQPLHVLRAGAGPTVVLIHGASGNLRDWTQGAFAAISERCDTIAFDRPGLGRSGWPGPAGATMAEQVRRMRLGLRELGVERAYLVGHSYGGSIALNWALTAPESVRGLLLIGAPSQVWQGGLGLTTDLLANPYSGPLIAQAVPALLPNVVAETAIARVFAPNPTTPGYWGHLRPDLVLAPTALRANALQLAALKEQIRTMAPRYPGLRMPIQLVHGAADATVPIAIHSDVLVGQSPQAELTRLPGVGHMPHHAALPETLAALARLLAT